MELKPETLRKLLFVADLLERNGKIVFWGYDVSQVTNIYLYSDSEYTLDPEECLKSGVEASDISEVIFSYEDACSQEFSGNCEDELREYLDQLKLYECFETNFDKLGV